MKEKKYTKEDFENEWKRSVSIEEFRNRCNNSLKSVF